MQQLQGCSVLGLSHVCKHREFIAQPAVQAALDYIWYGMTKHRQPIYKVRRCGRGTSYQRQVWLVTWASEGGGRGERPLWIFKFDIFPIYF